jgi:hypothetical protein
VIRNLTPHPINLYPAGTDASDIELVHDGPADVLPVDGPPVRLAMVELGTQSGYGAPVELVEFGHAHNLPEKVDGTWLVVSLPVALACLPGRDDLLVPYLEVRGETGSVVGCRMLARPV